MIELTYGCNLRCVHCYNPTHQAKDELGTAQIKALIDQLIEAGGLDLAFTGGEIFTRRDLFEILAYAAAKGCLITLLTTATLITPRRADRIQALHPHCVEISIYGVTQATYERVTRIPGSFTRFMTGVRLLRERAVPLLIKMPVMTLNRSEEHTSELQSLAYLVCRLLLEKKKKAQTPRTSSTFPCSHTRRAVCWGNA